LIQIPEDIINGCLKGDGKSQNELYRLVSPIMYGLCLQYAGDEDEAKDIMQEGFIKVFRKIEQYSGKGSFTGWIRRIMINTALEKYRTKVNMQSIDERIASEDEIVDDNILESLTAEEIIRLIQQLSPQYRLIFNLYAIEGYSHKEISEMTGISEGTSKSNLSRARAILQKKVMEIYENSLKIRK
jgi:RNA polymerase sigma-70 factor (ECF subfamily)